MPTNTYVALDTKTIGTAVPTVTFTNIPQGYTDLVLVVNGFTSADIQTYLQFNGDSSAVYSVTTMLGDGAAASSSRESGQQSIAAGGYGTSANGNKIVQIQNYSNTTTFKTSLIRANAASAFTQARVGLWRSTAAITSITHFATSGNFAVGSTFTIYGIAASSVGAKATGGTIYTDSQYFYHVFDANGTFTPTQSISADVLVVAGGGGGGGEIAQTQSCSGGGGGAGGLLGFATQSLTATNYSITVGGGGAGGPAGQNKGTNGVDSQFAALTLVKGGGGGGSNYTSTVSTMTGLTGGSGGGAGGTFTGATGTSSGGLGTAGQGTAGGHNGVTRCGGGGGGAGVAGGNALDNNIAGAGGNGISTYSSWGVPTGIGQNVNGTYFLAGGGGGGMWDTANVTLGAGGLGGGARGNAANTAGSNALAFTGGGGSGASASTSTSLAGGNGGSGVVIVRYAK